MIDRLKLAVSVQILRHLSLYFKPIWKATAKKEIKPGLSTCRDSGSISVRYQIFFILQCCVSSTLWERVNWGWFSSRFQMRSLCGFKCQANHTVKIWNIWDSSCNDCPTLKVFMEWTVGKQLHISPQFL